MSSNHSPFFRLASNRLCQYASIPFGKAVATDFYVHRSLEDDLPALLRLLIFAARQIVGEVEYDVLKIAQDGRALSFLSYPDFDAH